MPALADSIAAFHLLTGTNINVTVWEGNKNCNPQNLDLTDNCFLDLNASSCPNTLDNAGTALFKNLTPGNTHTMAIWTDEDKQNDFSFCLTRIPKYECGDSECYSFIENKENCPEDCTLIPTGDDCLNFQDLDFTFANKPNCNCFSKNTTIGASFHYDTDIFSCDDDTMKASVFYRFITLNPNVEFDLIEGENINITLLKYIEGNCNPESFELTNNCFNNLSAIENSSEALITNLKPYAENLESYILAIWTKESEATDFKFCLKTAPEIICGDGICYDLAENSENCPQDCLNTSIENKSTVFQIYPNPAIDNIFIKSDASAITNINIISMDGKVWHQQSFTNLITNHNLNLNNLPEGMYYAQISSNKSVNIKKFLKMN